MSDIFRLIGRDTKFRVTRCYLAADFIPSVVGVTLDGKRQTVARVVDVEFVKAPISRATAKRRLAARWNEQCNSFPTTRNDIPLNLYIRRNIACVMAGGLLESYEAAQ